MASRSNSHQDQETHDPLPNQNGHHDTNDTPIAEEPQRGRSRRDNKSPEPRHEQLPPRSDTPSTPSELPLFDWEDFQARYERALQEADDQEREILKEADNLSRYFRVWASAASEHDNERAVKRLQTRQRYVNLSEERMAHKQEHYTEVIRAFENALALLKST